jgi:hypothetical protein
MRQTIFSFLVALALAVYGCGNGDGTGSGGSGATGGSAGAGGSGGSGGAAPECDPLQQDCTGDDGCYVNLETGEQLCASVGMNGVQDEPCQFINGCDVGYGCNLIASQNTTDRVCAFFCDPDGGSPSCGDGPGPAYDCRRISEFYGDAPNVSPTLGMCVDPLVFPEP